MHNLPFDQWYNNWTVVAIYVLLATGFTLGFLRPRRRREWRGAGIAQAFFVALFTEMFGLPLTIYLLAPALDLPPRAFGFYESHLWAYLLARTGVISVAWAATLAMTLANLLIWPGVYLVMQGWGAIYRGKGGLVTTGVYGRLRHPQYLGILLVATGFLLMWPTLPTIVMYPVLLVMYARLAGMEEAELKIVYGKDYRAYRRRVQAFFPIVQLATHRRTAAEVGGFGE